jgi:hypothetical protein
LRDQRHKGPKRQEIITAWTLGRRESRKELARLYRPKASSPLAGPLLVRMVVRVAIQLFQVFASQFILRIDFEGAFKVQPRLL